MRSKQMMLIVGLGGFGSGLLLGYRAGHRERRRVREVIMIEPLETVTEIQSGPQDHEAQHPSAWRGAWERPMEVDEDSLDPLTVARMTDHNVRGRNGG